MFGALLVHAHDVDQQQSLAAQQLARGLEVSVFAVHLSATRNEADISRSADLRTQTLIGTTSAAHIEEGFSM
jgi:hypothetical protein